MIMQKTAEIVPCTKPETANQSAEEKSTVVNIQGGSKQQEVEIETNRTSQK